MAPGPRRVDVNEGWTDSRRGSDTIPHLANDRYEFGPDVLGSVSPTRHHDRAIDNNRVDITGEGGEHDLRRVTSSSSDGVGSHSDEISPLTNLDPSRIRPPEAGLPVGGHGGDQFSGLEPSALVVVQALMHLKRSGFLEKVDDCVLVCPEAKR